MNRTLSILFLLSVLAAACSSPSVEEKKTKLASVSIDPQTSGDTLKLYGPAVLFMWPDSLQAEQMKSEDSDAFYTIADDYSFYNSQLMDLADSLKIKNYSTSSKYLDFSLANDKHLLVNRSASEELWWALYLYNGADTPQLQSTVDIDAKYLTNFFRK
ncbi:MAG: hypothetical protein JWO44_704 [Bacteroidetes bacterium]|nr:hypothetical protein [Bacteroidota bacterium]